MRIVPFIILFSLISLTLKAQVMSPPEIQCASTNTNTGDITITYDTSTVTNPCGGNFIGYVVHGAQSLNGNYTPLDTIKNRGQIEYDHLGNGTVLDWFYFMEAIFDCPGATAVNSDTVSEQPLSPPTMNFVTVTPNDNVQIDWDPSSSSQTFGYKIFYCLGGGVSTIIDTIQGVNNTTYTDTLINPDVESATYCIEAIDSCKNPSPFNPNPHNSMFLEATPPTACEQVVSLNWNPYINWPSDLKEYQVRVSTDDTSFVQATLAPGTTSFDFDLSTVTFDSVCVVIRSVSNNNVTSNSNDVCFSASGVDAVGFNFLTNLTVTRDNKIRASYILDTTADIDKILIRRRADNQDSLETIRETNPPTFFDLPQTFLDNNVNPKNRSYEYRTRIRDVCQQDLPSNKGSTIHLTVERGDEFTNDLEWNSFELGFATLINYKLFRNVEGTFAPVETFSPGDTTFNDNVVEQLDSDGQFCYFIEANYRLNLPNDQTFDLTSRSNIACVEQATVSIMPNAFTPRGLNNELTPRIVFPVGGNYTYQIYTRWGEKIFETNQIGVGWDGTHNGEQVQTGGYVYRIEFTDPQGNKVEREGTVILFK